MIYRKNKLKEIIFPLGGIGTGSVGLAGNGEFVDWEIFNRPNKGSRNKSCCFAIKAQFPDGNKVVKVLQGDHTKDLNGQYKCTTGNYGFGYGPEGTSFAAFPHFKNVKFDSKAVEAFLDFIAVYPTGTMIITNEGERGIVVRQNKDFQERPVIRITHNNKGEEVTGIVER